MDPTRRSVLATAACGLAGCAWPPARDERPVTALVGGTVLDLSGFGWSHADMHDAVVLLAGGRIQAVGRADQVAVPPGARVVDARGRFIVPGYIDGYCGMNSQAQANAYLAMGVTGIVAKGDSRRGRLATEARPAPRIFEIASAGVEIVARTADGLRQVDGAQRLASEDDTLREIERHAQRGVAVLHLLYPLPPSHVRLIARRARALGLATVAELGATTYTEAADAGVASFVHSGRYLSELAPRAWVAEFARDAFGEAAGRVAQWVEGFDPAHPDLAAYAQTLARSGVGLIATLSATYPSFDERRNLWNEPAAAILDPAGIDVPTARADGSPWKSPRTGQPIGPHRPGVGARIVRLERVLAAAGARHLAGSGASALGALPGLSLHTELELLTQVGLTPREALAAATENFSQIYGWRDVGRIAPGAQADVLVLRGNPALDIREAASIERIFQRGEPVDRDALLRPG
jgi:Amidohydrolase family